MSERTALRYANDIKEQFGIKKITYTHLKQYFNIS